MKNSAHTSIRNGYLVVTYTFYSVKGNTVICAKQVVLMKFITRSL